VFVLILLTLIVLSLVWNVAGVFLVLQLSLYFFTLGLAGVQLALKTRKGFLIWGLPIAIAVMHIAWGSGFLWSGISSLFKNG
jgi:hypothetical protein